ncbi:MAG: TonB-dependent receptor [Planctomycetes bacterium]|nr:TonB-dependent receptor [Planctomycetota bacterium]
MSVQSIARAMLPILMLGLTQMAWPQFSSNVQGVVQDPSLAVIPGVTVTLTNLATGVEVTTVTSDSGVYRFSSLAPGRYLVSARASGFQPTTLEITLQTAQTAGVNLVLQVRGTAEEVTISAQAPVLNIAETRIQTTIEREVLQELPLKSRDGLGLAVIAPGVTGLGASGGTGFGAADNFANERMLDFNAGGRNLSGNQYTVDGLNVTSNIMQGTTNLSPNPDSIEEIAIQTNTFSVEGGWGSSIQIAVTTKSGSNDFHGTANYMFNNQHLTARTVFTQKYEPFKKHYITGTLGGPVVRNKTFFFVSTEALRSQISMGDSVRTFESTEFVNWAKANFPNSLGTKILAGYPMRDTTITGVVRTAADVLGAECGTPAARNVPCNMPMVMTGLFRRNVARNAIQWNVRADQYLNANRDRFYVNYYKKVLDIQPLILRQGVENYKDDDTVPALQASWSHTFSPSLLNEVGFGYLRMQGKRNFTEQEAMKLPSISIGFQGTGISLGGPNTWIQHNYNWRDVLSWVRGSHSLRFGFGAWHGDDDARFHGGSAKPSFYFNNLLDLVLDNPYSQSGLAFDPLTGKVAKYDYWFKLTTFGAFVQDEWKARPNVTVTAGVRWDDYGNHYPAGETKLGNIVLGQGSTMDERIAAAAVRQMPGMYYRRQNKNITPRVGIAWDPSRAGRWSIRGGIGLYRDWIPLGEENRIRANPPSFIFPTLYAHGDPKPVFSMGTSTKYPFGFALPTIPAADLDERGGLKGVQANVGGVDPAIRAPKTISYLAGFERQLVGALVGGATYSGSRSWDHINGTDFNRFPGDLLDGKLHRLNPSFGQMIYELNRNKIYYNGMILTLRGRWGPGSFQSSYTLAKVEDYGQGGSRINRDGGFNYPDQHEFELYKSYADWDIRQRFSLSGVYNLPTPHGHPVLKVLFGRWTLSSVTILQSGTPFMVVNTSPFNPIRDATGKVVGYRPGSGDYNADGLNYDYPNAPSRDLTGKHSRQDYIRGIFTAADFPAPAPGTQGNLKRHPYRNPGFISVDTAAIKNVPVPPLGERGNLQLRFEFFNVLNRVNLLGVSGSVTGATFGRVTSTLDPRIIQLAARISF